LPVYPVYDHNGEYYNLSTWDNPLLAAEGQYDNKINTSVQGNIFLTYELIKDLTLKADFSGEYWVAQENTFVTAKLYGATATKGLARASIMDRYNSGWVGNISATYDKKISENHELKLFAAAEQRIASSNYNLMSSEEISREAFLWYNMAAFTQANHYIDNGNAGSVFKSVFGRVNYGFKNRYLLEATVRRDGSSKFGPKDKWGTFPAASAGWKLSEEEFIKRLQIFDQLKLRVTWGQAGNDNIRLYQWMPYMLVGGGYSGAIFGGNGSPGGDKPYIGAEIARIPNKSVHWEKSTTTDIGLDMGFLKNRLRFAIDLYNRNTADLLWDFPLPLYTGYGNGWAGGVTVISNVAEMNNKGIELNLGADIISTKDLFWTLSFSFSKNVNKVVDLADSQPIYRGVTKIVQGKPIGNIWGYQTDGIFQEGDDIQNTPRFSGDEGLGDQRYVDANNNGILSDQDRGIIGSALPDFIYGIVSNITYKSLELSIIANGVQGVDLYNGTRETLSNGALGKMNGGKWLMNSWTPENTHTDIPRMSDSYIEKSPSDRFVEDASFLRISNIQLSYTVPAKISSKVKMKNLSAYISLQNCITITGYSGYDPEMHSGGDDNLDIGLDQYNYPSKRSVTFGIKVGF
jgi:TonB-linked SusC/RagA family outer membrane protein